MALHWGQTFHLKKINISRIILKILFLGKIRQTKKLGFAMFTLKNKNKPGTDEPIYLDDKYRKNNLRKLFF